MISHKKKFFFAHIPKTGGNSIQTALKDYADEEEFVYFNNRFGQNQDMAVMDKNGQNIKHRSVSWFLREHPELKDYYKFTCVRNPWDRAVSRYFWAIDHFDKRAFKMVINHPEFRAQKFDYDGADFIMKFENLQEDFNKVCNELKIEKVELPTLNKSKRGDYRQYYDEETKALVAEKFKVDIEELGYEF